MKKILVGLACSAAILLYCAGCSQNFTDAKDQTAIPETDTASAPENSSNPVSDTVPASEPLPPPPYILDRSNIPDEINTDVMALTSEDTATYGQVLDEAQRQGGLGEEIDLTAYRLSIPQIKDLTARCTDRKLLWQLDIDGVTATQATKSLNLSGHNLAGLGIDLYEIFGALPKLNWVNICSTGFTNEEHAALQDAFPDIRMIWEIVWPYWTIRTDTVAFSTMKGSQPCRLVDEHAKYLRYCTDMVALDLGHNNISDWSFLKYMPNLKILIAVDNLLDDLSWLQYTPKLEYLEFFVGKVTDLSFLQYTPNMKDLNISYNPISDATYLYNLPKLERLWMEHTRIPYSEFEKLQEAYPNATLVYNGAGSIDQGWRTHERYFAMREMYKKNYVHELFMDKEETE